MNPLLAAFVPEARELLQRAADGLLRLERDGRDAALINEVFRAVHTLKGSSGLFPAAALTRVVHAGEDLLGEVRNERLALTSDMVDRLLDALDQVGSWVGALEQTEQLPHNADAAARRLVDGLNACLETHGVAATDDGAAADPSDWRVLLDPSQRELALASGASALAVRYRPDEGCFFRGEDPLNLLRQLPDLVSLRIAPCTPWPALADLNPYGCNLVFQAVTTAPRAEVEHLFRYVPDQIAIAPVVDDRGSKPLDDTSKTLLARMLDEQRRILRMPGDAQQVRQRIATVAAVVANLADGGGLPIDRAALGDAVAASERAGTAAALLALLESIAEPGAGARAVDQATGREPPTDGRAALQVLKVDAGRVDALMNLIGELVVAKNGLPFLARRAEDEYGNRAMARAIKDQYAVFDRLTLEMQGAITQIRMLPVSEAFARFPRLVRDIARKLDKRVDLVVEGEETAADKTIIEAIGDPLLHIVRNALDHGIETPAVREAAGKPPTGTVRLAASQEGDHVVIAVCDDGAGIDPDRIRRAAVEKGVVGDAEAGRLSDQEALDLIFRPGFSTAATVSDLSGRGVGMDVVRTVADRLGGSVTVASRPGAGTDFRLSLPLSMAITRVMMVEAGGTLFGIPMDVIAETVRLERERVRTIKQAETFVLRDTVVPLLWLTELLGMRSSGAGVLSEANAVLVVRVGGSLAGLVVDRFREGMDVILKPMEGVLATIRGFAGTALLGDGRVLLVLNLKELL